MATPSSTSSSPAAAASSTTAKASSATSSTTSPASSPSTSVPSPAAPITVILQTPPSPPKWTEEVQAIATPVVALIAAAIASTFAYRQWKTADAAKETARNKLKLDLFDKRFAIYSAAAQLTVYMSDNKARDNDQVKLLLSKLAGAEFVFDEAIDHYLTENLMGNTAKCMSLMYAAMKAEREGDAQKAAAYAEERKEHCIWFDEQLPVLKDKMRPYLLLTH